MHLIVCMFTAMILFWNKKKVISIYVLIGS